MYTPPLYSTFIDGHSDCSTLATFFATTNNAAINNNVYMSFYMYGYNCGMNS